MAAYEYLPVGVLPTHRAVRLTLRLGSLREPVRSIRKPRTIPHPQAGRQGEGAHVSPPWRTPFGQDLGAHQALQSWTRAAEDWLL